MHSMIFVMTARTGGLVGFQRLRLMGVSVISFRGILSRSEQFGLLVEISKFEVFFLPCWNPCRNKITVYHHLLWLDFFFFLPEMLPDLVWLHFIQKLPQILAGTAVVCSVWLRGLCKPAYSTHTHSTVQYRQFNNSVRTPLYDTMMWLKTPLKNKLRY